MLKPFIDPCALEKTKFCGTDWKATALEWMTEEQIPKEWGGKGMTWTKKAGPWISMGAGEGGDVESVVNVAARDVSSVAVTVEVDGSSLRWKFTSVDYDVEFGIVRVDEKKEVSVEKVCVFFFLSSFFPSRPLNAEPTQGETLQCPRRTRHWKRRGPKKGNLQACL